MGQKMRGWLRSLIKRANRFGREKPVPVPGCDDAPVTTVERSAKGKDVTLVYPYYENPRFLVRHLDLWASYPSAVSAHLNLVLVDDGSPNFPAAEVLKGRAPPFPISLFRIEKDIRWCQHAARNIGMHHARDGFCLLTDMDLMIPADTIIGAVYGEHSPEIIYRFSCQSQMGQEIVSHPNSWFMTRAMFWRVGGYDEALTGIWGTDDDWRRRCVSAAPIRILPEKLTSYDSVEDASTAVYARRLRSDRLAKKRIIRARPPDWKPITLTFPYHEVRVQTAAPGEVQS